MKKIEIAGGGLAGLSLGIALRRFGIPVLLREASTYPRHRVCGEFINGVTENTLEVLGISPVFSDALRHRSTRWWMGDR
ncbi:MAG: 2-polyprenyl-6-methoxyphenol hydroxylase-like FAD-dependent oxidoreductase, partial [Akkermansiaceae bacterium]